MIAAYVVAFIISVLITRLVFSIPTIVRNLKSQTNLLALIARNTGATAEEIKSEIITTKEISERVNSFVE